MLVANHSLQLLIPFGACAIAVTYDTKLEDFYTEATTKAKRLLPPTFEIKETVTVIVSGNGLRFVEKYLTKERADRELDNLAKSAARGDPMFVFGEDVEYERYEESLKKAIYEAKRAATPAYKAKGVKDHG